MPSRNGRPPMSWLTDAAAIARAAGVRVYAGTTPTPHSIRSVRLGDRPGQNERIRTGDLRQPGLAVYPGPRRSRTGRRVRRRSDQAWMG